MVVISDKQLQHLRSRIKELKERAYNKAPSHSEGEELACAFDELLDLLKIMDARIEKLENG